MIKFKLGEIVGALPEKQKIDEYAHGCGEYGDCCECKKIGGNEKIDECASREIEVDEEEIARVLLRGHKDAKSVAVVKLMTKAIASAMPRILKGVS